jgi:cytochrome b561
MEILKMKDKTKSDELESAQELLSDPEPWENWESKLVVYSIIVAIIGLIVLGILINWLIL